MMMTNIVRQRHTLPKSRVAIVMSSTPKVLSYASLAAEINNRYAVRHGYELIHEIHSYEIPMPKWEYVRILRQTLPKHDAVFCIDSDAIFNLQHVSLDFLINDSAEFAGCSDWPNGPHLVNAGAIFFKNTRWTRSLIDQWWAMRLNPEFQKGLRDQEALDVLLRANLGKRVRIYPAIAFNSIHHELKNGRRDTFILHFMATDEETRRFEFSRWLNQRESKADFPEKIGADSITSEREYLQRLRRPNAVNRIWPKNVRQSIADWVLHCADPLGPCGPTPRWPLPLECIGDLVEQADAHGVLGALLRNLSAFATNPAFAAGRDAARRHHRLNAAFSLMLAHEADALMADVRDLPATVVKGPVFSRTIYPEASLRCFTDIDILIAPEALPRISPVLAEHGFLLAESNPQADPREWKWVHRSNERLIIEVQTDLIHAESLRGAVSLPYSVIAAAPDSPAAVLLVALVHGGGHHYERLQHVVDVCQAARALNSAAEERRFVELVQAARARFVAVAGLTLAAHMFQERRCRDIALALGPARYAGIANLLLDRTVVMSTMNATRARHGWRRQAFRWLMKQGSGGAD